MILLASPPDIRATFKYNKLTANEFEEARGNVDNNMSLVAFLQVDNFYCEVTLKKPALARYVLISK